MAFWATQAEVEAKIYSARLKNWGDKDRDGLVDTASLTLAFQEAQAICSSFLLERYGSYLSGWSSTSCPWLVKTVYLDLVVWSLATGSNAISPAIQKRYELAMDTLTRINDGKQSIYDENNSGVLTEATPGYSDVNISPEIATRIFRTEPEIEADV